MSLRQEELPRLEWIVETVKEMKEKFFFAEFPTYKEFYKQYKKDVDTFKYASDEPMYRLEDKSGLNREYTRPELLFIPLRMGYHKLLPVVQQAQKAKQRVDEREAYRKREQRAIDRRMLGRITPEEFEELKARRFLGPAEFAKSQETLQRLYGGLR